MGWRAVLRLMSLGFALTMCFFAYRDDDVRALVLGVVALVVAVSQSAVR